MTSRSCFYLVFFALLLPCRIFAGEISLVENGKSAYTIIIPDEPLIAENKAAGVLQRYVQQVCGVLLPVKTESAAAKTPAIFIGKTEAGSAFYTGRVQHDGYVFVTARQQIFIAGLRGKGSVYGVYDFLERYFGCRKYDASAAVFQHLDKVSVPDELNEVHNPAFVYRESYYPPSADPEYLEWHKLQQFTDLWGIWGHSFFRLVPPDEYFKAHPEYFSLVNGKRVPRQLCLSNDAVFFLVKTAVQNAIARNPDALYWSLSQMDGGGYCTCPHCAAADAEEGGPQGSLIR
ncbi:MAG: DUF4838 domain-containing protein, partial [Mucilaginibacter polytrichastri]|nr:DUF4838 domain-containing protein [Mucilaginibacter polytrichastri]